MPRRLDHGWCYNVSRDAKGRFVRHTVPAPLAASGGRAAGQLAAAATRLPQPLNGKPTPIVALDHLANGDADVVIVANSEPMVSAPPCWRGTIANVDYVEGRWSCRSLELV